MKQTSFKGQFFTLEELTASATAKRLSINNTPTPTIIANLQALTTHVLDPLRERWGAPIIVPRAGGGHPHALRHP